MELLLFGIVREIVGTARLTVPPDEKPATVKEVKTWLARKYPQVASLTSMAVAVDSEYAGDDRVLSSQSEIALIPPVSGG